MPEKNNNGKSMPYPRQNVAGNGYQRPSPRPPQPNATRPYGAQPTPRTAQSAQRPTQSAPRNAPNTQNIPRQNTVRIPYYSAPTPPRPRHTLDYTVNGRVAQVNRASGNDRMTGSYTVSPPRDYKPRRGVYVTPEQREYENRRRAGYNLRLYQEKRLKLEQERELARLERRRALHIARLEEEKIKAERQRRLAEKKKKSEQLGKIKKKVYPFAAVAAILLLSVFSVVALYRYVFVIRNITVNTDGVYTEEEFLEAANINIGDRMYSFNQESLTEKLSLAMPRISSLTVSRDLPDTLIFDAVVENECFFAELRGETRFLSDTLRTLTGTSPDEARSDGAVLLLLPEIKSAVAGSEVVFADERTADTVKKILKAVLNSGLSGRINTVDCRDVYNITMVCDRKYLLEFGTESDIEIKLRIATNVLKDEMFEKDNKAIINLRTTNDTGVIIDNSIELIY